MNCKHFWVEVIYGYEGYDECMICKERRERK